MRKRVLPQFISSATAAQTPSHAVPSVPPRPRPPTPPFSSSAAAAQTPSHAAPSPQPRPRPRPQPRPRPRPPTPPFSSSAAAAQTPSHAPLPLPPWLLPPTPSMAVPVLLNIYDMSPINKYLYWFGLGIFHSGLEVHGMEFMFRAHGHPSSGVFQVDPKRCPGFIFRRSVCVGTTDMSRSQVRTFLEHIAEDYHGDTYHLIFKNSNHFTADVCKRLTGKPIPAWVNRLARFGSVHNCVLPENIMVSAVRDETAHLEFSDDDLESNSDTI